MQQLEDLIRGVPQFDGWNHSDRIRFIGWYLHTYESRADFEVGDIRRAYKHLNLTPPSNFSQLANQLVDQEHMIKRAGRLALDRRVRADFDANYGQRPTAVAVTRELLSLPAKVPGVAERAFLDEAIKCFGAGAYRAAIVMSWNLAYDHLLAWLFKNHLAAFNAQWPVTFPAGKRLVVAKREDFADAKESHVIQVCRMANLFSPALKKMLDEKLDKRNSAAHPSDIVFTQIQAEAFIEDIVQNVLPKLV